MRALWIGCLLAAVAVAPARAQSRQERLLQQKREKAQTLTTEEVSQGEERVRKLERARFPENILVKGFHGVRPLIGGMPAGSGTVLGLGYVRGLEYELVKLEANARYSTRDFTQLDASAEIPTAGYGGPFRVRLDTEYRDYTSLRFYGLGNDSDVDNKTFYREIASTFGGSVEADLGDRLQIGANGSWLRVDAGDSSRAPTLGDRIDPASVPGFIGERTEFAVYGANVTFDFLDAEIPAAGLSIDFDAKRYDDRNRNRHGFTRFVADVKGYIPLGYRNRYLALRFRTSQSMTDSGQRVPFYLMETIGGAKSVRGFREYRFRDMRNVYVSAEYRWEVWTYLDFAFFFDAGKVFSEADDFNFSGLHTGYGFGARFHTPAGFVVRFDVARSSEGMRLHIGAGPSF